jgi:hypothetical protein
MINQTRRLLTHDLRQQILINIPRRKARFQPRLRILVTLKIIREFADLLDVVILVPAREHDELWVRTQASDIAACFCFDGGEEGGEGWVGTAGEEKVLPYEDTELVAGSVEGVFFVDTAAPYPVDVCQKRFSE